MPEINGKQVIFKDTLAAAEWWPIMPALQNMAGQDGATILSSLSWDTVCALIKGSVKSWEFAGEPDDPEAVGQLDNFTELIPLIREVSELIGERTGSLGESVGEST